MEAQKGSMYTDPCTFKVEPNYVVKAWGGRRKRVGGGGSRDP